MADETLIPAGYSVVSVTINSVSYTAYLEDLSGVQIADTVVQGDLY
jgi:hypothetical protein